MSEDVITPVELRECAQEYRAVTDALWIRFRETGETIDDDIKNMVVQKAREFRHED